MTPAGTRTDDSLRDDLHFDDRGLVPVVTQDADSGQVLMVAYADREAVAATLTTRQAHYHSRSRGELWRKGKTSGNVQDVVEVRYDCDGDALLYRVRQTGPACHTGQRSCFYRELEGEPDKDPAAGVVGRSTERERPPTEVTEFVRELDHPAAERPPVGTVLELLEGVVSERLTVLPEGSYVTKLHQRGLGYVAQKVIEEAGESAVAALEHKDQELVGEAADLLFHLTVLLRERELGWANVASELAERHASSPRRG